MILFCSSNIVEPPNPIFHFPLPFYIFKMNNGVECVPHHRMCISNWLIEFIIRYWKSEKASQTSAKFHIYPDWSEKSRKILRSAKCTKGVSQIEPHRISLQFWAKIWLMNLSKSANCANLAAAKYPTTSPLQSCWLQSDCSQNILGKMSQV